MEATLNGKPALIGDSEKYGICELIGMAPIIFRKISENALLSLKDEGSIEAIHKKLGHVSKRTIKDMIKYNAVDGLNNLRKTTETCELCCDRKTAQRPHSSKVKYIPINVSDVMTAASVREIKECRRLPCRELIGFLNYVCTVSRPDIAYALSKLFRYLVAYIQQNWNAAKNVLKYLITTKDLSLIVGKTN